MQRQHAVDPAPESLFAVAVEVYPDDVVAVAGVDGGRAGDAVDIDDIVRAVNNRGLVSGIQVSDTRVSRLYVEVVVVVAQPYLELLELRVADAEGHAHAGELIRAELAAFLRRVARGVAARPVHAAATARDRQPRIDEGKRQARRE